VTIVKIMTIVKDIQKDIMTTDFKEFARQVKLYHMLEYNTAPMWSNKTIKDIVLNSFKMNQTAQACCGSLNDAITH
jgi:hypothetical protein